MKGGREKQVIVKQTEQISRVSQKQVRLTEYEKVRRKEFANHQYHAYLTHLGTVLKPSPPIAINSCR